MKQQIEDFVVEEIPAYEPCGQGEHLYLWIEKRGMSAEYLLRQIAKGLDIPNGEIGTAGLKDRHAVTRQWVSVPQKTEAKIAQLDREDLRVLQIQRHTNKLRPGHLRGNRFHIRLRSVKIEHLSALPLLLDTIRQQGLPNYYGSQRFGHDGETYQLGLAMLTHNPPPKVRNPFLRKLALSALQSWLFNRYLGKRFEDGLLRIVLPGEVLAKWPSGGLFVTEDVATEQKRFDQRELVCAGPMFGVKMYPAQAEAAEREQNILKEANLTTESFAGFGKLVQGTRRHNLVYVDDLQAEVQESDVLFTFTLPAGSYATVLLREIMKTTVSVSDGEEE